MEIIIDHTKCTGTGDCVRICPQKAIALAGGKAIIDPERCDKDGICITACPNNAIRLEYN